MTALLSSSKSKASLEALELAKGVFLHRDLVTEKINVLGQSGGGKTYTAMKLAELMLAMLGRIFAFDLVGAWNGLLSSADGLHPGFTVTVIGGARGHLPLNAGAGRLIADIAFDRDLSVVCDLSQLFAEDEAAVHTFVADCLHQLFKRHQQSKKRRHLFFEEAQELFPQEGPTSEQFRCRRIGTTVCKIGRNFGLGYTTISQEPQSVSKRILNQAGTLIAVRTIGENERKAINGTVRSKELDLMNVLPTLTTGEAMLWSPAWLKFSGRVRILPKVTFDSSRTPEEGEELVEPKVLATVELEQLRAAMATAIAEVEATDPTALQRRVRQLEAELAARPPPAPAATKYRNVIGSDDADKIRELHERLAEILEAYPRLPRDEGTAEGADPLNVQVTSPVPAMRAQLAPVVNVGERRIVRAPVESTEGNESDDANEATEIEQLAGNTVLIGVLALGAVPVSHLAIFSGMAETGGGYRKALKLLREEGLVESRGNELELSAAGISRAKDLGFGPPWGTPRDHSGAIARWQSKLSAAWPLIDVLAGPGRLPVVKVAATLGMSPTGGGFRKSKKKLRQSGLVREVGDVLELTSGALALLKGQATSTRTHAQIVDGWRGKLGDGPWDMLVRLVDAYPKRLTAPQLADQLSMVASGGGFRKNLKTLRGRKLVVESDDGIAASPSLWP